MGTTLKPQINGNTLKSQVHQGNMVQRERFKRPPPKGVPPITSSSPGKGNVWKEMKSRVFTEADSASKNDAVNRAVAILGNFPG